MKAFGETVYLDAVLTPNRSLTRQGLLIVLGTILLAGSTTGLMFWSLGAGPILAFIGADVLIVSIAFWLAWRRQREETRVTITAQSIHLSHMDARGRQTEAVLPSAFTRIELDEPAGAKSWLRIEHGRKAYVIGRFLTPAERASLAAALRRALATARAERPPAA